MLLWWGFFRLGSCQVPVQAPGSGVLDFPQLPVPCMTNTHVPSAVAPVHPFSASNPTFWPVELTRFAQDCRQGAHATFVHN